MRLVIAALLVFVVGGIGPGALALAGPAVEWSKQFGTSEYENSRGVATDSVGGIYITGCTGRPADIFVRKYDTAGNLSWNKQFGSPDDDWGTAIATHASGDTHFIYIVGQTMGVVTSKCSNAGDADVWLAKYDADGDRQWIRQLGSSGNEEPFSVTTDGDGCVYITGYTDGVMDPEGANAGADDVWLAKYDGSGNRVWLKQFGWLRSDWGNDVAADGSGGIYFTGITSYSYRDGPRRAPVGRRHKRVKAGDGDAWLAKYDANGNEVWIKKFSSSGFEQSSGVATAGTVHVYITGETRGDLFQANAGAADAFLVSLVPAPVKKSKPKSHRQ